MEAASEGQAAAERCFHVHPRDTARSCRRSLQQDRWRPRLCRFAGMSLPEGQEYGDSVPSYRIATHDRSIRLARRRIVRTTAAFPGGDKDRALQPSVLLDHGRGQSGALASVGLASILKATLSSVPLGTRIRKVERSWLTRYRGRVVCSLTRKEAGKTRRNPTGCEYNDRIEEGQATRSNGLPPRSLTPSGTPYYSVRMHQRRILCACQ